MHSRERLAGDLRALGLTAGDTAMVHASVRAVGEVAGGPDEIHLAIKDVLTPEGTLLMYASCPRYFDEIGRGNLTPEQETEILGKLPPFDANTARIVDNHLAATGNKGGRVGDAECYLIGARALLADALRVMEETARAL